MSWTPPLTWTNGLLVAAATLNQQIRDNLRYLKGQLGAIHLENAIDLQEVAPPTSPATGRVRIWNTNDPFRQMLYARFSDGTQRRMTHYAAIATRSTEFTHSGGWGWQAVPLTTLAHSSHPSLTLYNGTGLVAPETGVYVISGSFAVSGSAPIGTYIGIFVDGTVIVMSGSGILAAYTQHNASAVAFLTAGQVITLRLLSGSSIDTTIDPPPRLGMVSV